jgi:general secretion pathway protein F
MRRVAGLLERRQKLRSKVISAMIYPSLLLIIGTLVVTLMMIFVVPKLASLFADAGRLLPASTRAIIGMSDFCRSYWWLVFLVIAVSIAGIKYATRSEEGKIKWGLKLLKIPVLGKLLAETETSKFCRMLAALLEGQVPILQAISITGGTINNAALRNLIKKVYETVQSGKPMGPLLQADDNFPELASRMITMGEESGEVEPMLNKVADRYEEKISASTERFVSVLEPIFIVVMGIVVGFIVIGMMQGMMAMSSSG